jgi:hypothetical protein
MDSEEEDADEEEENQKTPKARKSKTKTSPKDQTTPSPKSLAKRRTTLPKLPKIKARRGRKPKDTEEAYDADQVAKDTKIWRIIRSLVSTTFISNSFVAYNSVSDAIMNPFICITVKCRGFPRIIPTVTRGCIGRTH